MIADALLPWRKKAYEKYLALNSKLSLPPAATRSTHTAKGDGLVFIDGFFHPELSTIPAGLICLPLEVALKSYGLFLQNRWAKPTEDSFVSLNTALSDGVFLYIPKEIGILPIHHVFTTPNLSSPRFQITLGKQAKAHIVQTYEYRVPNPSCNLAIDIAFEPGSHLQFTDVALTTDVTWMNTTLRATLKRDARLETFHATDGAKSVRFSATAELLEENSSVDLKGLVMLSAHREAHFHALVDHAAPHCTSRQHVKMALNDHAKSSFEGKIYVRSAAQKTEAYQLNNNLLLSETASATAKPNLEIFADDVKASHGATVAQLSEEDLFYLRARGIPLREARSILTHGFCRELIDQQLESLRTPLLAAMSRTLHA